MYLVPSRRNPRTRIDHVPETDLVVLEAKYYFHSPTRDNGTFEIFQHLEENVNNPFFVVFLSLIYIFLSLAPFLFPFSVSVSVSFMYLSLSHVFANALSVPVFLHFSSLVFSLDSSFYLIPILRRLSFLPLLPILPPSPTFLPFPLSVSPSLPLPSTHALSLSSLFVLISISPVAPETKRREEPVRG